MKLRLEQRSHQISTTFKALLQERISSLKNVLQIDEARVTVERRAEASPAFRVAAHLVTPGPDVSAEAVDHTLGAALRKLFEALRQRIGHRNQKRDHRNHGGPIKALLRQAASAGQCRA
ncbi:MAG: HPF/RaiA family ribosome-associated protein [Verrucomicrobiota bacterium]